jgi:hypothetical protein
MSTRTWDHSRRDYLAKALAIDIEPGSFNLIHVMHDNDCPKLDGGACDCDTHVERCPGELTCLVCCRETGVVN